LEPEVAFVAVQRADEEGGAHCWGALGVSVEACLASRQVVLLAEEIVGRDVIASDPNRVLAPPFRVSAVVHEPFGCHPSPVQGYYGRDHAAYHEYHELTRDGEGERLSALRPRTRRAAALVDYGE
jgi:glutaconate CoA-transferase subunit A